jgi:glycosyltransferase involved in cell wall biosynthesis
MTDASPLSPDLDHGPGPVIIVPCYNEEHRLDRQAFVALAESGLVRLLFVDDGSTDGTSRVLGQVARASAAVEVVELPRNVGKAEAVRQGFRWAIDAGAPIVGYFDADLATPGPELLRMVRTLEGRDDLAAVFGSRVARLGSHIERSPFRHYTGRIFATFASWALDVAVYDTQCGAKVFRVNPNLVAAFDVPFRSSWSFDVQLCRRLFDGTSDLPGLPVEAFLELPLDTWQDVAGSKVDVAGSVSALWDVVVMGIERRWR